MNNRKIIIGCPKLDDARYYVEKFTKIFNNISIQNVTCLRMEVPCYGETTPILKEAINRSGKRIPLKEAVIRYKMRFTG